MIVKNIFKHIVLVLKHKWYVFKFSIKLGIPLRGLAHDMSKFSPTEFWESVKYYNGSKSPITVSKQINGYSKAWLHHKGRNKHHLEYWVDNSAPNKTPIVPYKYVAEMICDKLAAGMVYNGKDWTLNSQIDYYMVERENALIHPQIDQFMLAVFIQISKNGLDVTLTKQNIKKLYEKYCIRMENLDENKI